MSTDTTSTMKHRILIFSIFCATTFLLSSARAATGKTTEKPVTYEALWKNTERFLKKDLPKSALDEVQHLVKKAETEKQTVQWIKAKMSEVGIRESIDPDSKPDLIAAFEKLASKVSNSADRAIVYSLSAELYANYYHSHEYTINERTNIVGFTPKAIVEWTETQFNAKIVALIDASVKQAAILQKTPLSRYKPLLTSGNTDAFEPTVYDWLMRRNLEILSTMHDSKRLQYSKAFIKTLSLPVKSFIVSKLDTSETSLIDYQSLLLLQSWLNFRHKANNPAAYIHAELTRIQYFNTCYDSHDTKAVNTQNHLNALVKLSTLYTDNEHSIFSLEALAQFYSDRYNSNDSLTRSFKRKAYDVYTSGIKRFPSSKYIGILKNLQSEITKKDLRLEYSDVAKRNDSLDVWIHSKNIRNVEICVYRVHASALEYEKSTNGRDNLSRLFPSTTLLSKQQFSLSYDSDFNETSTKIRVPSGDYGIYEFTISPTNNPKNVTKGSFVVSDLTYIAQSNNQKRMYVVNRYTGKPVPQVTLNGYWVNWNEKAYSIDPLVSTMKSDSLGFIEIDAETGSNNNNVLLFFEKDNDKYLSSRNGLNKYTIDNSKYPNESIVVLTDRSVYRPGQTVYFKGIVYSLNDKQHQVVPNKSVAVKLINANEELVITKQLSTNEFGSFSGKFILPESGVNGAYRIYTSNSSTTIWVEEYKRPTFEVVLERPTDEVRFGASVQLSGRATAYAGYPISDAKVSYQVIRKPHFRWFSNSFFEEVVAIGNCTTAKDGRFTVEFIPTKSESSKEDQYYIYSIKADVTDQRGETEWGEKTVSVGDKTVFIVTSLSSGAKIDRAKPFSSLLNVRTLNDEKLKTAVSYNVFQLPPSNMYSDDISKNRYNGAVVMKLPMDAKNVLSGIFQTKDDTLRLALNDLKSGAYILQLTTKDDSGNLVETLTDVVLYSENERIPPVKSRLWLLTPKTVCTVGEQARIQFGTSIESTYVLYQLMQGSTILESKWIHFSNELRTFDIPFLSSYGMGVNAQFTFVSDEKLYTRTVPITLKNEVRKLTPKLSVFRNKLLPGEKAEWTLSIPEANSSRTAEVLIDMYDATLDVIHPHRFPFNPTYRNYAPASPGWTAWIVNKEYGYLYFSAEKSSVYRPLYYNIYWYGFENGMDFFELKTQDEVSEIKGSDGVNGVDIVELSDRKVMLQESGETSAKKSINAINETIVEELPTKVAIRSNFNETAFFYPQLRTDEQGNVAFAFTVPESLTRWNVKMLAHTKDLYSGYAETQVVTQKDLMVQLNMPRFVRRSDKLLLRASVVNLTDKELSSNVKLELINPDNNQAITLKDGLVKTVTVAANGTQTVEWELTEFAPFELVVCKVVASAGSFSDGEQRYLPVLPDKILITESLPMTVRVNQTRSFTLDNLLKNGNKVDSKSLTVEFSPNPVWYAVQALPTLSVAQNDNAIDYFTAYYVNTLAAHIANASPTIAAVFQQWKQAGGSREALLSNLEKNKELKTMLLEETPWVMAAENETEQKKQIALLFDLNMQKQQNTQYWNKLVKLQKPSGGFAWFEGMPESRYVTQYMVLNYARIQKLLNEKEPNASTSLQTSLSSSGKVTNKAATPSPILNAIAFLDNELSRDYQMLKKYNSKYLTTMNLGDMQWFYLHLRSEYPDVILPEFVKEAVNYYTTQAYKYWQQATLYGKAATALIAARNDKKDLARSILTSLEENALKTDEMGMYWARNTAGYGWNERPVMVQTALLEAFAELNNHTAQLDELKIWLLRQKQTQRWDSPLSTVDAIYALLYRGSDWLKSSNEVELKLGSETLRNSSIRSNAGQNSAEQTSLALTEAKEAGTGYIKQTFAGSEVSPKMSTITATLKGKSGFGWGALYWQYYQQQDLVQESGNALKVSKKLFVEQLTPTGNVMTPIENVTLKKGDRVITRLVVNVDRDIEFVALKDLRAACFEPVEQRSAYMWKQGVGYYQTSKDASTQFFFTNLPKGNYVFEYEVFANNAGEYTSGITTLQCQYAPEFVAHSGSERIVVK